MDIIVCIKQVPNSNQVKLNSVTNVIERGDMKGIINPNDLFALEEAMKIKDCFGGTVKVISMGVPSTAFLLKKAVSLGADEAVLLSDPAFKGSDTLATSYILSAGIKKMGKFDLIICGQHTADGGTGHVGPGIGITLNIPYIVNVNHIENISNYTIQCRRDNDTGYDIIKAHLPCVISVAKNINQPRFVSLNGIKKARRTQIKVWNSEELGVNKNLCGLAGSPTRVKETYTPCFLQTCEFLEGFPKEQAKEIINRIIKLKC